MCEHAAHAIENLFVKSCSLGAGGIWMRRRDARSAKLLIEVGSVFPQELLNDPCLAHAGRAVNDKAGHAISRRVVDQVQQSFQNAFQRADTVSSAPDEANECARRLLSRAASRQGG